MKNLIRSFSLFQVCTTVIYIYIYIYILDYYLLKQNITYTIKNPPLIQYANMNQNTNQIYSVKVPEEYNPRSNAWPGFYVRLREVNSINLPKACRSRNQAWPMFYLVLREIRSINLPKICGERNQT